jgi:hypothetical protein
MALDKGVKEKYPDFDLFYLEDLDLYHALQDEGKEYMINIDGDIIYKLPDRSSSDYYWTNFSRRSWDKTDLELNSKINYWIQIKYSEHHLPVTSMIFSYKNGKAIQLLEQELILNAAPLSTKKLLLQIAIDKKAPFSSSQICIYDTEKNECKEILSTKYQEEPFSVHKVFGLKYLFSVFIEKVADKTQDYDHELFWLFNSDGERLVSFDTTIGPNGEKTWFDPGKRGLGITYKILDQPVSFSSSFYHSHYGVCNVLIDGEGHCYGDFYHIAGQKPATIGKSSTRYPKYLDKKLLCLALPDSGSGYPDLVIIDEHHQQIRTGYEYPWMIAFSSNSIIKDKKIFGRTCLTVINNEGYVVLIDLDGNEVANTKPIKFKSLTVNYAKLFTLQVTGK